MPLDRNRPISFLFRVLLILWISGNLPGVFAQDFSLRSGFAVVTPVSGSTAGLVATETLVNRVGPGITHAIMASSPLLTSASALVRIGPIALNSTAIAVANPSTSAGTLNLVLTDTLGGVVLNATVPFGGQGQIAKYLNEFFPTPPTGFATPLLLTVSSEIPIGIVALNFRDGNFASIPLMNLSTSTSVTAQSVTPATSSTSSPGFGLGLPPVPATTAPSSISSPGFGLGLPPQPAPAPPVSPVTVTTSPVPTITSIGVTNSLVFPQIVIGGGWTTEIAIGNTSGGSQTVRIDFFGQDGVLVNSLTNIVIPPRGVFFFSSDAAGAPNNSLQ